MSKKMDLTPYIGQKFGRLTIKEIFGENKGRKSKVLCQCDCGNEKVISFESIISGKTRSCGCYRRENPHNKSKAEDLIGKKYNHLLIIDLVGFDKYGAVVRCLCDCGNIIDVSYNSVHRGNTKSCGCARSVAYTKRADYHGQSKTRLYSVWLAMKARCYNPSNKEYNVYGGRGIVICDEWKNDFMAFKKWADANGFDENKTYLECSIDRIDPNGNYEPDNCRWVNHCVQSNNKVTNVRVEHNGEVHNLAEWSRITGIPYRTLQMRNMRGTTGDDLFYKGNLKNKYTKQRKEELR